jgi:hypothetical protein
MCAVGGASSRLRISPLFHEGAQIFYLSTLALSRAGGRSLARNPRHRPVSGGVVLSKLSKLLNQEDALSAPCLRGDWYYPQAL